MSFQPESESQGPDSKVFSEEQQRFNLFLEKVQVSKKKPENWEFDGSIREFIQDFVNNFDLHSEFNLQRLPQVLSFIVSSLPQEWSFHYFSLLLKSIVLFYLKENYESERLIEKPEIRKEFLEKIDAGKKKLVEILGGYDKKIVQEWAHHLLYTATYFSLPEILEFIPNIQELLQQDCVYIDVNDRAFIKEGASGSVLHCTSSPMSMSGRDMEKTINILLKNGVNVFITLEKDSLSIPGRNGGTVVITPIQSCLMTGTELFDIDNTGKIDTIPHSLTYTLLPALERGAGFLVPKARFCPIAVWKRSELGNDIEFFVKRLKEMLDGVSKILVSQGKVVGMDAMHFAESLLNAEIIFKVSNSQRFILNMAEFIQYLDSYERLTVDEREVIDTMMNCVNRLPEEQNRHLAIDFKESLNAVQLRQRVLEVTTQFLSSNPKLPGDKSGKVIGLICSYLPTLDFIRNRNKSGTNGKQESVPTDMKSIREQWKLREANGQKQKQEGQPKRKQ